MSSRRESWDRLVLLLVRKKSMRRGVWFRALTAGERGLVNLTIRCVEEVRSRELASALVHVISKLVSALRSRFLTRIEALGRPVAAQLAQAAAAWAHPEALKWRFDLSYIRLLGVNRLGSRKWMIPA